VTVSRDPVRKAESDFYLLADVLEARRERHDLLARYARVYGGPPQAEVPCAAEQRVAVSLATQLGLDYNQAVRLVREAPLQFARDGTPLGLDLRMPRGRRGAGTPAALPPP
jgi:hypothetical protein